MVLNESIQFEHEIEKESTSSKIYYSQLTTISKYVCKYDSSHRIDSRNHGDYDPYDTMIPTLIIKLISEIALDQLISSRDTIHVTEAQLDFEKINEIV